MPVARYQLPDGRIARFEVPEGTTPDQAQQIGQDYFANQQAQSQAGPTQSGTIKPGRSARGQRLSAQREAELEAFLSSLPPERRALIESVGPLEALAIGMGRGLSTIGAGVGLTDPEDEFTKESMEQLGQAQPAMKGGEILGQALPFVPLGLGASAIPATAARVGATAALGAAEGGLIARGKGEDIGTQLASAGIGGTVAGALELGLPVAGRIGGKLVRRALGRPPKGSVIDNLGNPSDELIEALNKLGLTTDDLTGETIKQLNKSGAVDPEQAARFAFLQSQGVEPTKAQVTRLADDFQAQQEAFKTSSRVREALEKQESLLTTRFDNAISDTIEKSTAPAANVADSLLEKASTLDNEISRLYTLARQNAPGDKVVRFDSLTNKLKELAPLNARAGGNVKAVAGQLRQKGLITKGYKPSGRISVERSETEIRQFINQLYDKQKSGADPVNFVLRQMKEALDDDVFKAAGDDIFKQGRQAKASFEEGLKRAKISKFDSRNKNLVRDVLENKINADEFTDKVVLSKSWRDADLKQLTDYLADAPEGEAALLDLKKDVLQTIRNKVFTGPEGQNGVRSLSRAKLEGILDKIGDKKLKVIFNPEENRFLKDMLKVAKLREPVSGTFTGRGPSAQAIRRLESKFAALPIMRELIDVFDPSGRRVMQALPRPKGQPIKPSQLRTVGALGGAGATTAAAQEENQ